MSEKTHDPTEGRIEQARKRGQVPVSRDFARVVVCWPLAELCFALERQGRDAIAQLFDLAFRWHTMSFDAAVAQMLHGSLALFGVFAILCFALVTVTAVAGFWGQFGVLIAPESLAPSPDKLNPVNALQNMFSPKKLQEIGLSLVKIAVLGVLAWTTVRDELPDIVALAGGEPRHVYDAALALVQGLFRLCMGTMLVLAVIDLVIQRRAHIESLRMSLDEIIREYKENEGDPMLKGERKALARELANSKPKKKKTEGAAAVVVNPTHFAIALAYDAETIRVPVVCAKGVDETAREMIAHAESLGIPVIRHVWLARTLYATAKEDEAVPRPTFEATALVITVAQALREAGETHAVLDESALPPGAQTVPDSATGPHRDDHGGR